MTGSRKFTLAGTLYQDATGSAAVAGATVTVFDSTGAEITLVTGQDGNFFTTSAITLPISVSVSECPNAATMSVKAPSGSCNSCHGASMRVHLP